METFRTEVHDLHQEAGGTLRLGLFDKTVTNPKSCIHEALRTLREVAPNGDLEVVVGTSRTIEGRKIAWNAVRSCDDVGLAFHSPNMVRPTVSVFAGRRRCRTRRRWPC